MACSGRGGAPSSSSFVKQDFEFNQKTLRGVKEIAPRWRRCVVMVDRDLGEALGQKYVEQTFGSEGKQRTLEMVNEIEGEMAKDIQSISWMAEPNARRS